MRLDVSLQQKQQLQLKLAPQMIQAIEILQLPNIDLKDRIDLELAENEVLEVDDQSTPAEEKSPGAEVADGSGTAAEEPDSGVEPGVDEEFSATIERLTSMAEEDREMGSRPSRADRQEATDRKFEALQATAAPPPSVQDLLAEQLAMVEVPERIATLGRAIVYSLDADGRLPIHPMARVILAATGEDGHLVAPLEDVVEGLAEADGAAPGTGDAEVDDSPSAYGNYGRHGTWGGTAAVRSRRARPSPRAEAQREARRRDRDEAREERRREAARVARTAGSLRRRMKEEGVPFDLEDAVFLFPLAEILDLLASEEVEATLADASRALEVVQSLEPRGVAGRTDEEILLLQLRTRDPLRDRKAHLVTHHLEDWKKNRLPRICQAMGISMDELKELLEEMRDLDPRPGARLRSERSPYLNPDVVIEWADGEWDDLGGGTYGRYGPPDGLPGDGFAGGYQVRLVNEYFPTLRISSHYLRLLEDAGTDAAVREMVKKKVGSARWLIDAIRQRQDTLLRVVREIVRHQRDFLDHGLSAMRPLKMQRIADDLGIHVSTVSRAIADKYAQTPQGILPLKFFFHGGTESADGTVESRLTVKDRVRQAIEEEDKSNPLSDEDLAKKLKDEGLNIARRTVTKYRKQLGLPSSRERREWR